MLDCNTNHVVLVIMRQCVSGKFTEKCKSNVTSSITPYFLLDYCTKRQECDGKVQTLFDLTITICTNAALNVSKQRQHNSPTKSDARAECTMILTKK